MTNIIVAATILSALSSQGTHSMEDNLPAQEARAVAAQSVLANTAKILGIPESGISIDSPFSFQEPPADALDFVEIIMAVEDELGVSIDNSALEKISGADDPDQVASHLSVRNLQEFVGSLALPRHPERNAPPSDKTPNDPLEPGDTGAYEQLVARPNPNGHVIVTVPDADELIQALARDRGRPLTQDEADEVRSAATSLVMSKDDADKLQQLRVSRQPQ